MIDNDENDAKTTDPVRKTRWNMKKAVLAVICIMLLLPVSVALADWDPRDHEEEARNVKETIDSFLQLDPTLKVFFDQAAGYVVFPTVGKGAFIGGVGYGRGWFYEGGKPIGKASITQLSAGAQIGGQAYSEIIFFRDASLVNEFKYSRYEVSGQATAVAVTEGVGKATTYTDGVAVFILPKGGLMAELSITGQRFTYDPFPK